MSSSPVLTGTAGEPIRVWKRRQVESTSEPIELKAGMLGPWFPLPDNQGVYVRGLRRRRDDAWSVTLFLVDAQDEPKVSKDKAWLFQPELVVRSPDGSAIFIKRRLPAELDFSDAEDRAMEMLYRRRVEFAVGHGVAVEPDLAPGAWDRATALRTAIIPSAEVERMEPRTVPYDGCNSKSKVVNAVASQFMTDWNEIGSWLPLEDNSFWYTVHESPNQAVLELEKSIVSATAHPPIIPTA